MYKTKYFIACLLGVFAMWCTPLLVFATSEIVTTKHNLSSSGPGTVKAQFETRICIFCHTPHNSTPRTPLWNRELDPQSYKLYESSTLGATIFHPSGPTRLCLSCHDGSLAVGNVTNPSGGIQMQEDLLSGNPAYLGTDISDDHPVSFSYFDSVTADSQINPSPPNDLPLYVGNVHCSTCHDAHDDTHGMFLAVDNTSSGLCIKCHELDGWTTCSMNVKTSTWDGTGAINPWPRNERSDIKFKYYTVNENGCQNCHDPHGAEGAKRLLNYIEEEKNCEPCHNGTVALKDVMADFQKTSKHDIASYQIGLTADPHEPNESAFRLQGHVECLDCHNPHAANDRPPLNNGDTGEISGKLELVSGVDQYETEVFPVVFEYEICFKCHSASNEVLPTVTRAVNENDTRIEFDPDNPSYHPVVGMGDNLFVPSIPSEFEINMQVTDIIYCTDCHDSDDTSNLAGGTGAKGPHGSDYAPLLRQQYITADRTTESLENYRLCYQCHDRTRLQQDAEQRFSLRSGGHAGHLGTDIKAPCSACHDPHGVQEDFLAEFDPNWTGDHTHLINFDVLIVDPVPGKNYPIFDDTGDATGSCTLICHDASLRDVTHTPGYSGSDPDTVNSTYP